MCLDSSNCSSRDQARGACNCGGRGRHAAGLHLHLARPQDVPVLHKLVGELALYENLGHEFESTTALFDEHLFGPRPRAFAVMAEFDGEPAGFAVWYPTYSTFSGRPGAFLEDLFVRPSLRRRGIGRALLAGVSGEIRAHGFTRLEWRALKWNEPALAFYKSIGAESLDEWTTLRLAL